MSSLDVSNSSDRIIIRVKPGESARAVEDIIAALAATGRVRRSGRRLYWRIDDDHTVELTAANLAYWTREHITFWPHDRQRRIFRTVLALDHLWVYPKNGEPRFPGN